MNSVASATKHLQVASVIPLVPVWRVDRVFDYSVPEKLSGLITVGSLVRIPFGGRKVRGIVTEVAEVDSDSALEELHALVVKQSLMSPALRDVYEWVARRYVTPRGVVYARSVPPRVRVKVGEVEPPELCASTGRLAAYSGGDELMKAIEARRPGVWGLRAAAGEDRGELIADLVAAARRGGGGASLVVVPEVRYGSVVLTSLEKRMRNVERVDSSTEAGERSRSWLRLASGSSLGAGGRGSLLAPIDDLRLLVVDDEHNPALKEDRSPRFDGRRLAVERARLQNAVCVLISATPTLETAQEVRSGRWRGVQPTRGVDRARRPLVEVVEPSTDRTLSSVVHDRIREALGGNRRVAILAPAPGYARVLWCASCRRSLRCPVCEAALAYERTTRANAPRVRCFRCGYLGAPPTVCPDCRANEWRYLGAGSERLAEQLGRAFPRARIRRVDAETIGDRGEEVDIYLTTWIGTKPALRPPVSLVVVLNADSLIRRTGFRAAERAYQALAEMAEWAGPSSEGGRLLIETVEPGHHAVQAVTRADYGYFAERELPVRQDLGYPPFAELVRVTAEGPGALQEAERAKEALAIPRTVAMGPLERTDATGARSQQLLVKCADAAEVAQRLRPLVEESRSPNRIMVDCDPV